MGMKSSSGPGPLVWIVAVVAIGAIAWFGWRSNQATPPAARPANTSAPSTEPAPAQQGQPEAPAERNGVLAG